MMGMQQNSDIFRCNTEMCPAAKEVWREAFERWAVYAEELHQDKLARRRARYRRKKMESNPSLKALMLASIRSRLSK